MTAHIPESIPAIAALGKGEPVQLYHYPPKPFAKKDVDIQVLYNGVCATDVHMIDDDWKMSRYPLVPGHEVVGRVLRIGPDVHGLNVGDVVGLGCLAQKCDKCSLCLKDLDNLCPDRKFTYFGNTIDELGEFVHHGGFSSFIRTDYRGLFKIPEGYPATHAGPLMCAGITVAAPLYEYCKSSFDGAGKKIGIIGLGGLGHIAVMFASKMGAETVVISRGTAKKDFSKELGAHQYIDSSNKDEMTAAAGTIDFLLVCASGGSFDVGYYTPLLKPYGVLHFVGVPDEPLKFSVMAILFQRLTISASPIGSSDQMRHMLDFAAKHKILPLIEIFPHSKANEALQKVRDNTIRFRAVLQNDLV